MSTWHYALGKKRYKKSKTYEYFIIEVFCDKKGKPWGLATSPKYPYSDFTDVDPKGKKTDESARMSVIKTISWMLRDILTHPIIDIDNFKPTGKSP